MPVTVRRAPGGKYRVVEKSGRVATNDSGTAVDGGGHATRGKAMRQARAINKSLSERGEA